MASAAVRVRELPRAGEDVVVDPTPLRRVRVLRTDLLRGKVPELKQERRNPDGRTTGSRRVWIVRRSTMQQVPALP